MKMALELYWKEVKMGFDLVVADAGTEMRVGGVRAMKRGIQAIAETRGYDPTRAAKDLPSLENAREFVESHRPWLEFFGQDLELQSEIRPLPGD